MMMYVVIFGVCGLAIWLAFRIAEQKGREKERLENLEDETKKLKDYRSKATKMKEDEKSELENINTVTDASKWWMRSRKK
tara:strand:- start:124 stop:363 length:240 start_codon:yes stop_codon:yes gene_type:complete